MSTTMISLFSCLVFFCCSVLALPPPLDADIDLFKAETKATDPNYRLPEVKAKNLRYEVHITPYLNVGDARNFTFDGLLRMSFDVDEENINTLVMNAKDLDFINVHMELESDADKTEIPVNYNFDPVYQKVTITLENDVMFQVNEVYILHVKYEGKIHNDMRGFYSSYYTENNQIEWLATTQFQPVHARKAFPCFDEPKYKGQFTIKIDCPESMTCFSNMRVQTRENGLVTFYETPKMSTYLIAFIVSKFVATDSTEPGDAPRNFRILARPGVRDYGKFAFDMGRQILDTMNNYTDIDFYSMNNGEMKMDHASIPDFSAGAMENWGLLTYREASLMIHPNETSTVYKQRCAAVITHEIAHMWFGDLVTCDWWSNTWLNEGFARFFQYYGTHMVEPDYGLDDQFIVAQLQAALSADTSNTSNALTTDVNSPEEISGHFGTITYNKGASVIRMIAHWISHETLQKGLRNYLKDNEYSSVLPIDLFTHLQNAAEADNVDLMGFTVAQVMESWTSQPGYPVLIVSKDGDNITIIQERFVKEGEEKGTNLYNIPITYTTANESDFMTTKPIMILDENSTTIPMEKDEWIIFNIQQTGFYRVLYDKHLYTKLMDALRNVDGFKKIHRYNRAQIVDDAFNFAREGTISYSQFLDIIDYLVNDDEYAPWNAAIAGFSFLRTRFRRFGDLAESFDKHILNLMNTTIEALGFQPKDGESQLTRMFRTNIMNLACSANHKKCIEKSVEIFDSGSFIDPDIREYVYCNALRYTNGTTYEKLWSKYIQEDVIVNEKIVILGALGCIKDQVKIKDFLEKTLDPSSGIRTQDIMTAFNSVINANIENIITAYEFLMSRTNVIKHVYGDSNFNNMISSVASRMSEEELKMFEEDLNKPSDLTATDKEVAQRAINNARKGIEWTKKVRVDIEAWLKLKYNSTVTVGVSILLISTLLSLIYILQ